MDYSRDNNFQFVPFTKHSLQEKISTRRGERKIGEEVAIYDEVEERKYFLLGINEDIGPQANYGKPGAKGAFELFLDYFLNIQSNDFLSGKDICVLGQINATDDFDDIDDARLKVEELDEFLGDLLNDYIPDNAIPIVIGGGHNNAYPLIRWASEKLHEAINVINNDPHADMRKLEGRHSGNSFSYGIYNGFIATYHVLGLHQSYNSQFILDELRKNKCVFSFFDDYLLDPSVYFSDLQTFFEMVNKKPYGIELDMDSIAKMPTSAITSCGLTTQQARAYALKMAKSDRVQYFHLPEAFGDATQKYWVGKTLSYLISDFIKANCRCSID